MKVHSNEASHILLLRQFVNKNGRPAFATPFLLLQMAILPEKKVVFVENCDSLSDNAFAMTKGPRTGEMAMPFTNEKADIIY